MDELRRQVDELSEEERAIVALVSEVRGPTTSSRSARELEHANAYPGELIDQMKQLGIFGLAIPEPWGEAKVSTPATRW